MSNNEKKKGLLFASFTCFFKGKCLVSDYTWHIWRVILYLDVHNCSLGRYKGASSIQMTTTAQSKCYWRSAMWSLFQSLLTCFIPISNNLEFFNIRGSLNPFPLISLMSSLNTTTTIFAVEVWGLWSYLKFQLLFL